MTSQLNIGISVLQSCYLKPGVLQSLVDAQPLTGVDDQQPPHQVFGCKKEIHSECCTMVTAVCQQSRSSTFVRDVLPLGWKHCEFSANYLLCDGQIPKVLMEWRVTAQTERQTGRERGCQTGRGRGAVGSAASLPDKEQDAEAPRVHSQAVACGGCLGEDLRSQVGWRPAQGPHQHGLLQDPRLVEVCHLTGIERIHWSEDVCGSRMLNLECMFVL